MSTGDKGPSIGGRALEALRAVALYPLGMRLTAHPKAMRALAELGYVEERQARWLGAKPLERAWFITHTGRELLTVAGGGDHG